MRHVSLFAVIILTVACFLSVSAQQRAQDTSMPSTYGNSNTHDSILVTQYLNLSNYYLITQPDSSVFWAEKTLSIAAIRNNKQYQQAGLLALKKAEASLFKTHQTKNNFWENEFSKQGQKINILAVISVLLLLCCIGFITLYFRQIKNNKILEIDKVESGERLKNFQSNAIELQQKNNQLEQSLEEHETQTNKAQEELAALQTNYNNLIKANEIKDKLIPMIAHDIRSPLATLQNTLALTRDNIISPEEFQQLSFALEGDVFNLRGMLENMLLWAREQMFEIKINKVKFDLSETFREVILMYRNNLVAKNITLHNYMPATLEIVSDKEIIAVVVRNLFSNAVKFTETNRNIYISQIFFNGKAYISIKDEGKGIPTETLKKLNNKQHITSRGTANEKGTGLGLMFSSEMLNKLNEVFDITSYPDKGTSVTFSVNMN